MSDEKIIGRKEAKELGLTHYFTGKPCKNGHVDKRYTRNSTCLSCHNYLGRRKYNENIEKERERSRLYYSLNKDEILLYHKKYREENPEKEAERHKVYRENNKDKIREYNKIYNIENKESVSKRKRSYYDNNRERYRTYVRNRRALVNSADGSHTHEDVLTILKRQRFLCAEPLCNVDLQEGFHVDHIMPLALGGSNWPSNLQCLCPTCNKRKHAKHPVDWALENGRLC